jgi:hypothetical protein
LEAGFNPLRIEDVLNSGVDDETIFEYATNKNLPLECEKAPNFRAVMNRIHFINY